jgi:acetyltransferase-like isoleucine patch superfamily enzyme
VSILRVSIGDGAIIGAGSMLSRNVGAQAIAVDVPATEIAERT